MPYPSGVSHSNISIEFYTPSKDEAGKIRKNKIQNKIVIPLHIEIPENFSIDTISYKSENLTYSDISKIYSSILEWINSSTIIEYNDPLYNINDKHAEIINTPVKMRIKPRNNVNENKLYNAIMKDISQIVKNRLNEI